VDVDVLVLFLDSVELSSSASMSLCTAKSLIDCWKRLVVSSRLCGISGRLLCCCRMVNGTVMMWAVRLPFVVIVRIGGGEVRLYCCVVIV
jgi:hypothetical protein